MFRGSSRVLETSSPKDSEKKSSPSEVAFRPRNQLEIIAVTHTFQGFFSNAGNLRQNPFFFFFSGPPIGGTCCCKAFRRCHFHSHCHVPPELPKANSFWQPGAGSDPPPVILFLHMASSVKRSLTFLPAPLSPLLHPHATPAIGSPVVVTAVTAHPHC